MATALQLVYTASRWKFKHVGKFDDENFEVCQSNDGEFQSQPGIFVLRMLLLKNLQSKFDCDVSSLSDAILKTLDHSDIIGNPSFD